MIVQATMDDNEVKQMLIERGLWERFLKGKALANADNDNPKVWSLLHKEPHNVYLFYGFAGYENEIDNGYVCQRVTCSPGEEVKIADMYQHIMSGFGGELHFVGMV